MQGPFFSELGHSISSDRFQPYRQGNPQDDLAAYAAYAWNIAICESLYPALCCAEIALRNSIHSAATRRFGSDFWFIGRLERPEQEQLDRLRRRIDPSGGKSLSAADFVSGLNLGFWVNLFMGRYEQTLWPRMLRDVFPYATRRQAAREPLYQQLNRIRRLRNRVFHYEPIWHWPDLRNRHRLILQTIGWISPAMLALTRLLDRFPIVYDGGIQPYAQQIGAIAARPQRGPRLSSGG